MSLEHRTNAFFAAIKTLGVMKLETEGIMCICRSVRAHTHMKEHRIIIDFGHNGFIYDY